MQIFSCDFFFAHTAGSFWGIFYEKLTVFLSLRVFALFFLRALMRSPVSPPAFLCLLFDNFHYNESILSFISSIMKFHLDNLVADYERIEQELANESVYSNPKRLKECMLQKKSLELSVKLYLEYKKMYEDFNEAKRIISVESDPDLIAMAKEEIPTLEQKIVDIEEKIKIALLPKDRNDDKNTILEIRSGAGGDEASLFAAELTEAYMIFARSE
jgi:hypothetical protein